MSKSAIKKRKLGGGVKPLAKVVPTQLIWQVRRENFIVRVFAQYGRYVLTVSFAQFALKKVIGINDVLGQTMTEIIDAFWIEAKEHLEEDNRTKAQAISI